MWCLCDRSHTAQQQQLQKGYGATAYLSSATACQLSATASQYAQYGIGMPHTPIMALACPLLPSPHPYLPCLRLSTPHPVPCTPHQAEHPTP